MKKKNCLRLRRALTTFSVVLALFAHGSSAFANETTVDSNTQTSSSESSEVNSETQGSAVAESTPESSTENNQETSQEPVPNPIDQTGLTAAIAAAEAKFDDTSYTSSSRNALRAKISDIRSRAEKATDQAAVDGLKNEVETAISQLVLAGNKTDLSAAINKGTALEGQGNKYTSESFNAMIVALKNARAVLANGDADQATIDNAAGALNNALNGLVKAPEKPTPTVDFSKLNAEITKASAINNNNGQYTKDSFNKVTSALKTARNVASNKNATQAEVNNVTAALNSAVNGLKKAEVAKPTPSKPSTEKPTANKPAEKPVKPVKPTAPVGPTTTPSSDTSQAATNDRYNISDSLSDSDLNGYELPNLKSFDDKRQAAIIAEALNNLSKPFGIDGEGPKAFNNLNFVRYVYYQAFGKDLGENYDALAKIGKHVALKDAQPGDLLFWQADEKKKREAKVGIYLGQGKYILADDENLEEMQKLAKETAEAEKKAAEEAGKEYKEKEIEIPGVRIFTLQGYTVDDKGVVTIDDTPEIAEQADDSVLLKKYTRENPDFAIALGDDFQLTKDGEKLLDSYGATMDFQINGSTTKFIEAIAEDARELGAENDVFASVMIAQAILETGSGGSTLSQAPHYNLFGIKGSFKGQSVNMATQEDDGKGNKFGINANFRSYGSFKDSLSDYVQLIKGGISGNSSFYKGAWRSTAKNYLAATQYLQGRYATDTTYANKLNSIIAAYNLTKYDEPNKVGSAGMIIQSRSGIPEEYRNLMVFPEYNGVNYNVSGSYPKGQCTWYAYNRIRQLGGIVDNFMGNGGEWGQKGAKLGYKTSQTPRPGYAISFHPGVAGSDPRYGHVAFVEAVGPNGILVSEGNVVSGDTVSYRVIPNSLALSSNVTYVAPK